MVIYIRSQYLSMSQVIMGLETWPGHSRSVLYIKNKIEPIEMELMAENTRILPVLGRHFYAAPVVGD